MIKPSPLRLPALRLPVLRLVALALVAALPVGTPVRAKPIRTQPITARPIVVPGQDWLGWISDDLTLALPSRTFAQTRAAFPKAPIAFKMPDPVDPARRWQRTTRRMMLVPDAFRIDGPIYDFLLRHDGTARSQSYLIGNSYAADAAQCENRFAGMIDGLAKGLALDPQGWDMELRASNGAFDPFALRINFPQNDAFVRPLSYLTDPLSLTRALIATPGGAKYGAEASENPGKAIPWISEWFMPGAPHAIQAVGHYGTFYAGLPGNCHVAAAITAQVPGGMAPEVPPDQAPPPIVARAALEGPVLLSQLYQALADIDQSPRLQTARKTGETLRLACRVSPADGSLENCYAPQELRQQEALAANALGKLGNAYRMAGWTFDEDRFAAQPVHIDMTLAPSDTLPAVDWDAAPRTSVLMLQNREGWAFPWFRMDSNDYPIKPLIKGAEADIDVTCLILADQSLFCDRFAITPVENTELFTPAIATIRRRSLSARIAPLRKDGVPAAGQVFTLKVKFVMPQE